MSVRSSGSSGGAQDGARPRRARIAAVVVTIAACAALLAQEGVLAQDASPASLPPASASPAPLSSPSAEGLSGRLAEAVRHVFDSVRAIRDLPAADDVAFRVIDRKTLADDLEALFQQEYSDEYLAAEDAAFTRLGLIGPDDDLAALRLGLYGSQVLAYYDPRIDTFSLVGPMRKVGPLESVLVAHEYAHALQDAAFDLDGTRVAELDQADASLAQQALVEGDATAVMYDWAARQLKLKELLKVSARAIDKKAAKGLRRMPVLLRRELEFPYVEGFAFVNAIRGRGDWAAVDDAWRAQPASTEQVLHPELYPDETPVAIELPDVAAALGTGWAASYEQTLGEMRLGVWVADGQKAQARYPVLPARLPRADVAAGWGGDRLVSLDGPDGAWAVVWQTDWDSPADARDFRDVARDVMKDLPGAHAVSGDDLSGGLSSPVLVLVADSDATLGSLETALGLSA